MNALPVAAPLDTDFAGKGAQNACSSVMRVVNPKAGMVGTGFLHSSGRIITAEHVVRGGGQGEIVLVTAQGTQIKSKGVLLNAALDLAIVEPATSLGSLTPLLLSTSSTFTIGTILSTWGYPSGYSGLIPLLTVGYLSGVEQINGNTRYVVNAAFNSGNSGGPLLHVETGTVIGVVASKLAPLPPHIQSLLQGLAQQQSGFQWTFTHPNGTQQSFSEAQIIAEVLQFLRSQTQLIVGHAVIIDDLRSFLLSHGLAP